MSDRRATYVCATRTRRNRHTNSAGRIPWAVPCTAVTSDHANVLSFLALLAGCNVELDALALVEALVAVALDVGEVNEDVITLLARDEPEAFFRVEELDSALCHKYSFLSTAGQPVRPARSPRL